MPELVDLSSIEVIDLTEDPSSTRNGATATMGERPASILPTQARSCNGDGSYFSEHESSFMPYNYLRPDPTYSPLAFPLVDRISAVWRIGNPEGTKLHQQMSAFSSSRGTLPLNPKQSSSNACVDKNSQYGVGEGALDLGKWTRRAAGPSQGMALESPPPSLSPGSQNGDKALERSASTSSLGSRSSKGADELSRGHGLSRKRTATGSVKSETQRPHQLFSNDALSSDEEMDRLRIEQAFGLRHDDNKVKKPVIRVPKRAASRMEAPVDSGTVENLSFTDPYISPEEQEVEIPGRGQPPTIAQPQGGPASERIPYTAEDDALLIDLKERQGLSWTSISKHFPGRKWTALQSRYSKILKPKSELKKLTRSSNTPPSYRTARSEATDDNVSSSPPPSRKLRPSRKFSRHMQAPNPLWTPEAREVELQRNEAGLASVSSIDMLSDPGPRSVAPWTKKDSTAISSIFSRTPRPYLRLATRNALRKGFSSGLWDSGILPNWQNQILHVDLRSEEIVEIMKCIEAELGSLQMFDDDDNSYVIHKALEHATEVQLSKIAWLAIKREALCERTREDLESFLHDAAHGQIRSKAAFNYIGSISHSDRPKRRQSRSIASLLREREIGLSRSCGRSRTTVAVSPDLSNSVYDTLGPSLSFTGTSGDVGTVAWAPDGSKFAAGSVCLVDRDSMQYNRPNNLLLGDLRRRTLKELPDHFVQRQRQTTGINASRSMHISQDPRLFMTVPIVQFSSDGGFMYSAGYDKCVRVWDVRSDLEETRCRFVFKHSSPIDVLAVNRGGVFATGCQHVGGGSVKVFHCDLQSSTELCSFSSQRATDRPETHTYPSSLRWGPAGSEGFLLAGFASNCRDLQNNNYGEVCLWNVETQQRYDIGGSSANIFDCTWNTNRVQWPLFAVGCTPGSNVNRGTRSVVRMYDLRTKYTRTMELECPAHDMNDVLYCPYDENIFAAGCTDGKTYIWDLRRHHSILHKLSHGAPLVELDESVSREESDTGIRFCGWGENRSRLYTGSSDGALKAWDVYQAPDEAYVKDIIRLNSGVMSGDFSPDFSRLLLGEVNGSVNVVEVGCSDKSLRDMQPLRLLQAPESQSHTGQSLDDGHSEESGVSIARELLRTEQMVLRPLGSLPIRQAVQGRNYEFGGGPTDTAADSPALRLAASEFQQRFLARPGTPCAIPACQKRQVKFTSEETADSGRSQERIPGKLKEPNSSNSGLNVPAAMKQCKSCGRLTRPKDRKVEARCERCAFACFRCGHRAKVGKQQNRVECQRCGLVWRADVLGYTLIKKTTPTKHASRGAEFGIDRPSMKHPRHRSLHPLETAAQQGEDSANLLEEIQDHYHSLWMDRPPSPL